MSRNYNDNTFQNLNYYNKFQDKCFYNSSHLNIIITQKICSNPLGINYFQNRDLNYIKLFNNFISLYGGTSNPFNKGTAMKIVRRGFLCLIPTKLLVTFYGYLI